jgi:alkanesulfonate monooxygenase SsuD/methylene tetrahydromethanopterin reductase-like flavin-dependent oxidoreductase (luciferase family)
MLRLTARYADGWNTAWLGPADTLLERRFALEAACAAEGRDPATLAVTVGVNVDYSVPGRSAQTPASKQQALSGSPEEIASGLRGYAEAGVAHVICALAPANAASLARLAEALAVYRQMGPGGSSGHSWSPG